MGKKDKKAGTATAEAGTVQVGEFTIKVTVSGNAPVTLDGENVGAADSKTVADALAAAGHQLANGEKVQVNGKTASLDDELPDKGVVVVVVTAKIANG